MTDTRKPAILWQDTEWRGVVAGFVLNGLLFGIWASRVPAFKESLALDPRSLGLVLLALAGGAIVSFPLAGGLAERWGAVRLTRYCGFGYIPALVLLALAPSPITLGIALFIFGAFHGSMDVAMNAWGAAVEQRLDRNTMSIFHATWSMGAGIGAASGYAAVSLGLDPLWHFVVAGMGGGAIILGIMLVSAKSTSAPANTGDTDDDHKSLFSFPSGPLLLVGLVAFSAAMGEGAIADWSAVFIHDVINADQAMAALGYAVFSIAMVITRLAGGWLTDRLGPVTAVRISAILSFAGLMIAVFVPSLVAILAGFALVGIGYAVLMPLAFSRAAQDPDIPPGPALASVATLGYGGLLLGPPIIGFVAQETGIRLSFLVLAALAALAFVLAPCLKRPHEEHQPR